MEEKNQIIEDSKKFKITIKLNKYKYFPLEEIEGSLLVKNNKNMQYCNYLDSPEFCFILTQKIANLYTNNCMKILKIDEQLQNYKDFKGLDISKGLNIPFKYKIPDLGFSGFCPSFRYFSSEMKSIISHTLSVEIPFLSNKTNINIFIKKPPEKEKEEKNKNNKDELDKAVFGDELIKRLFKNVGRLSYYIKIKKSIPYKGKLDAKKIIIKGNKINTIKESIQMPKTEFVPLSSKSIHKPKLSGEISNYTPPMKNSLIICQYYLIVKFILEDNLMKNKTVKISFDLYDDDII